MATSAPQVTLAEGVDKELTCAICLSRYNDPKVLPCLHMYCKGCLEDLTKKRPATFSQVVRGNAPTLSCPQCKEEHRLPEGGVGSFRTHFTIGNLLELLQLHEATDSGTSTQGVVRCETELDENPAVARCIHPHCCYYLCESCLVQHRKHRLTKTHEVISLDEIKRSDKWAGAKTLRKTQYCQEHNEELRLFCRECKTVICLYCTLGKHRNHESVLVQDIRPKTQTHLEQLVREVKAKETEFRFHRDYVKNVHSINRSTFASCKQEVNETFDRLSEALEARRSALLEELCETYELKCKQVETEADSLDLMITKFSDSAAFTTQLLDNGSDLEVVSMSKQTAENLAKLKEAKWDKVTVKPTLMRVIFESKFEIGIQQFGTLSTIGPGDLTISNIEVPGVHYTDEEIRFKVQLSPELSEEVYIAPADIVRVQISHEDSTAIPCNVKADPSLNSWTVSYIPERPGSYTISIYVNDVEAAISPLILPVSISPLFHDMDLVGDQDQFDHSDQWSYGKKKKKRFYS